MRMREGWEAEAANSAAFAHGHDNVHDQGLITL
jgi:hypothetical protein